MAENNILDEEEKKVFISIKIHLLAIFIRSKNNYNTLLLKDC